MTVNEYRSMLASLPLQASAEFERISLEYEKDPQDQEAKTKRKNLLQDYRDKVTALAKYINDLFDKQEAVTTDEYSGMLEQFSAVRKADGELRNIFPDFAKKQADTLSTLEAVALGVDPTAGMNLASAVRNTLSHVVRLKDDPDYLGAVSSQRFMMKMKKDDGTEVDGFFTKDARMFDFDPQGKVDDILQKALDKHPEDEMLARFIHKIRHSYYGTNGLLMCTMSKKQEAEEKIREQERRDLYSELGKEYVPAETYPGYDPYVLNFQGFIETSTTPSLDQIKHNANIKEVLKTVRGSYTEGEIEKMRLDWIQYGANSPSGIKARAGSTRAGRNTAMSRVAALLGASNLIANSTPMTVEFNGNLYHGAFMEKANGAVWEWDKDKMMLSDFRKLKPAGFDGQVLEELATLQVIDYICQNVDRHASNLIYDIGEDGKLKHVIGIDNDLSFGLQEFAADERVQKGVRLNDITVIPKSLAEAIKKINPNTLMGALSSCGLSNSELLAAGTRFKKLKDHIRDNPNTGVGYTCGKVKIIPHEKWAKMNLSYLSSDRIPDSNFNFTQNSSLFRIVGNMYKTAREWVLETEQDPEYENKLKADQAARKRKTDRLEHRGVKVRKVFTASNESDLISNDGLLQHKNKLNGFLTRLKRTQHWYQKTHEEYTDMRDGLAALAEDTPSANMDQNERLAFEAKLKELENKVNRYIAYKAPKHDTWKAGRTRLKEAKDLAAYLKSYRESFHIAYNEKLDAEMDAVYQEYVNNRKVDNIAHAIVCGVMKMAKDANIETVEASVRNGKAFVNLLNSRADALDHYAELSETDPKAVFLAYVKELKDNLEKDVNGEKVENAGKAVKAENTENAVKDENAENAPARKTVPTKEVRKL